MLPIVKFPRASCWEHKAPLYISEDVPFREKTDKCIAGKMPLWDYFVFSLISLRTHIRCLKKKLYQRYLWAGAVNNKHILSTCCVQGTALRECANLHLNSFLILQFEEVVGNTLMARNQGREANILKNYITLWRGSTFAQIAQIFSFYAGSS